MNTQSRLFINDRQETNHPGMAFIHYPSTVDCSATRGDLLAIKYPSG